MRAIASTVLALVLASSVAACGASKSSSSTNEATVPANPTTSSTASAATQTSRSRKHESHKKRTTTTRTSASRTSTTTHHTTPHHTSTTTTHHTSTTTTHPATTTTSNTTPPAAYARPIRATLVGENHHPTANKLWPYTVTATDAKGRPLPGKVDVEFVFNGTVVGHASPPTDPLKNGRWHDRLTFPAQAIGEPLDLRIVVHTPIGSVTLDWPVKAKK